ncbi:MAG: cytochrome c3 family protein [bacterium]|nr:cytochrome c3 family protein [bacterium]
MKKVLAIAAVLLAMAGLASAQTVVGTAHDLSSTGPGATTNVGRVCVYCHTPHQATAANGQDPLWNHALSAVAAYGVYGSDTLDATPGELGGAVAGTAAVSNLCLSCHDGTVAVHSVWNAPNEAPINDNPANITIVAGGNVNAGGFITGNPNVGDDLTNDHPVNFTYDAALAGSDGGLVTPDSANSVDAAGLVPLFAGTVQCASCHDPHDDTNAPFLVVSNSGSALCTTCHNK